MLEWGLGSPFTPQDKPPLAIAMLVKSGDMRKWKRYRLVVARKEKLHLDQRVLAVLDANTVTRSGFFPCSISKEYLYGYATDGYRSPLWLCAAFDGSPTLVHARSGRGFPFIMAYKLGNWSSCQAYTTSMPTDSSQIWQPDWICPWREGRRLWLLKRGTKRQVLPRLTMKKECEKRKPKYTSCAL